MRIARGVGVLSLASQKPLLPPLGVTGVKLRGLHLLGTAFDFWWTDLRICVALQAGGKPLELRVLVSFQGLSEGRERDPGTTLASGARLPIGATETCVCVATVEVAGVGYA